MMMIPINNSESVGMDIREFRENTLETRAKKTKNIPSMHAIGANTHAQRVRRGIPYLIDLRALY